MKDFVEKHDLILMEAAVVERLRRLENSPLHPSLVNAPLVYDSAGRSALREIYVEYLEVALASGLPMFLCTPTWRANRSRVKESPFDSSINADAAGFLRELCAEHPLGDDEIRIGGLMGCANDCYSPSEALSAAEAEIFHGWQADQLAEGGVDFLLAATLPNVDEATGIARAMQSTGLPYLLSFVVGRDGCVLDGTPLAAAVEMIDSAGELDPLGFMVNCAYPTFIRPEEQPAELFERLIGCQANASSLDHCDLDDADLLRSEPVAEWGELMLSLHRNFGMKVLGGCCGTNGDHLRYIAGR